MADPDLYKRLKLLGEGSFGKAYLAECVADKTLCVLKQVDLTQMKEEERRETIKEARILEALRHPNIVKFREVYKTKKGRLCIIMDYADGGDLSQKVRDAGSQHISEYQILDWFTQICLALKHVHDRKIIHRDLKSQNIFLTKEGIIKMGDFGIARVLNHTREKCKTMVGTPYYLSPEIIDSKDYSFKTDIWSLGVILYELCALKPPFNAESLHGLALKIVRGQYPPLPDRYSNDVKNLVKSLLNVDPLRRPSIHEVLKMPVIVNRIRSVLSESVRNVEFSHTILHKQNFVNHNLMVPYDDDIARKRNQISSQPVLKSKPYTPFNQQRPAYQEYQRPIQSQAQLPQASPIERGQAEQKPAYGLYGFMAGYAPQPVDRYNGYQNQNRFNILKDKKPSVSPMRAVGQLQQQQPPRDKSPLERPALPQIQSAQPQAQAAQPIQQPSKPRKIEQPLMIQECQMNNRYSSKEQQQQKSPLQRIQSAQQQLNQIANKENIEKPAPSHVSCEPDVKMKDSHMILNDLRQKNKEREENRQKMRQDIKTKRDQQKQKTIPAEELFVSTPCESIEEKDSQPSPPKEPENDQIQILAELEIIANSAEEPMVCEVISECAEVTTQQDISDRDDGESFDDEDEREEDEQTHFDMIKTILIEELGAEQLEKSIQLFQRDQAAFCAQNNQYDGLIALFECMQHLRIDYLK